MAATSKAVKLTLKKVPNPMTVFPNGLTYRKDALTRTNYFAIKVENAKGKVTYKASSKAKKAGMADGDKSRNLQDAAGKKGAARRAAVLCGISRGIFISCLKYPSEYYIIISTGTPITTDEKENVIMKKLVVLMLALILAFSCVSALADNVKMDRLTFQFVPSKDADVIITGTANLPELVKAEMAKLGYDIGEVDISVGTSYEATGEAMSAGTIDVGWLPGGTYAIYSQNKEVDVILTATRAGLSNDSENPADWNGDANKTLPTDEQVTFYRALIYAAPSEKGKALAAKVNAGEQLTWDELNDCVWAVANTSSSAGYIYPTMWLMDHYDGKKISDLSSVITLGYADSFAQAASEQVDIVCCYADGRRDYETAWNLPVDQQDETGKQGMGREDVIWNELNVIGVTPGIYNDTVAITTAKPEINNPEFIAALQQALINIINTEEGKAIFSVYSHTGYAIAQDSDYDGARQALTVVK